MSDIRRLVVSDKPTDWPTPPSYDKNTLRRTIQSRGLLNKLFFYLQGRPHIQYSYRPLWEKHASLQFSTHTITPKKAPEIKEKWLTVVKNALEVYAHVYKIKITRLNTTGGDDKTSPRDLSCLPTSRLRSVLQVVQTTSHIWVFFKLTSEQILTSHHHHLQWLVFSGVVLQCKMKKVIL